MTKFLFDKNNLFLLFHHQFLCSYWMISTNIQTSTQNPHFSSPYSKTPWVVYSHSIHFLSSCSPLKAIKSGLLPLNSTKTASWRPPKASVLPTLMSVIYSYRFSASSNQVNVSFLFETFSFLGFQDKKLSWYSFCLTRSSFSIWLVDSSSSQTLGLECPCSVLGLFFFLYTYSLGELS